MNSPKLAFACVPFALLAPVVVSGLAPRANDAVVIAVDAFGRPVPGLELEVVLRGKDGKLTRTTEKPSAKTGKARVKVGELALADVNVKGDFDVAAQTSWKEGDTRHVLLTVVPLVPFEARFTNRDGTPQKDVAVEFTSVSWRDTTILGSDGEDQTSHTFVADSEGVIRGKVPRGSTWIEAFVPGSFSFTPEQSVPVEGFAPSAEAVPLHDGGHVFELFVPPLGVRTVTWYGLDESPITNVTACKFAPALAEHPTYVERFTIAGDSGGSIQFLEALDTDERVHRIGAELMSLRRGTDHFVMSIPPLHEIAQNGWLADEVPRAVVSSPPEGFGWTWHSLGNTDVRERIDARAARELGDGMNSLWAAPLGRSDFDHVVRFDAFHSQPVDIAISCAMQVTKVDLRTLPVGHWAIVGRTVLVNEESHFIDVTDWVALDAKGRAQTLGSLSADDSQLIAHGPGLASSALRFAPLENGSLALESVPRAFDFEFVRVDGSPASFVCFTARTRDSEVWGNGSDTRPAWSDEKGHAKVLANHGPTSTFELMFFAHEELVGTRTFVELVRDGVTRIVVPDTGRLSIDGPALVGGEPRPMEIRFAPFVEGDERDVYERDAASRKLLTNADGELVVDDVPVGTYVFEISETAVMSPSLGGLHRVDVTAPMAKR